MSDPLQTPERATPNRRAAGILAAVGALMALAPAASSAPQERASTFREDVSVTVIEVPVQVLRDGQPVRGLTRDDFELYDEGVRQPLVGFDVIDTAQPAAAGAPEPAAAQPVAAVAPPLRGRHLLLLFDFQFGGGGKLLRAFQDARRILAQGLAPGDRAALAYFGGASGVRILVGFTDDEEELGLGLDVLEAMLDRRKRGIAQAQERLARYWLGTGDDTSLARLQRLADHLGLAAGVALSGVATRGEVMGLADYNELTTGSRDTSSDLPASFDLIAGRLLDTSTVALEPELEMVRTLGESLVELATLLRDVPNPKHLVYFSRGFSSELIEDPVLQTRGLSRIQAGIRALQAAGWVVQSIDLSGIPDALANGRGAGSFADPSGTRLITGSAPGERPPVDGVGFGAVALAHISHETGGLLHENFNRFDQAWQRVMETTAVTYLLAYQPERLVRDGSYHHLDVKLADGVAPARVLHRAGYAAGAPEQTPSELERTMAEADLIAGDRTVRDLAAEGQVWALPAGAGGTGVLPFVVDLSPSVFTSRPSDEAIDLEVSAYGLGARGTLLDMQAQRVRLDPAKLGPGLRRGGVRLSGALDLPVGRQRVRLLVRELGAGRAYAESFEVSVPPAIAGAETASALPPLLLDPAPGVLFLETGRRSAGASPWRRLGVPLDLYSPAAVGRLERGGEKTVFFAFYPPPSAGSGLAVRILDPRGEPIAGAEIEWLKRLPDAADGARRLVGVLRAGSLAIGRYRLEISVREGDRELCAGTSPFEVVPSAG